MVSAQYDRFAYLATFDCFVESKRNLGSALAVSIQYASLRAHYELILSCLANPVDVVSHLSLYLFRSISFDFFHHLSSDAVGSLKVFRVTRSTNPAERTETVVEEHRSHNILNIRRITELAIRQHDVSAGTLRLQEESIAIVEEIHTFLRETVDCSDLTTQ